MAQAAGQEDRRGCLTAWLILLLVVMALGAMFYFYTGMVLGQRGTAAGARETILLSIAFSAGAAGAAAMLARKRYGFYLLVIAFVGAAVLQLLAALRIDLALAGLLNIVVLWWLVRPSWRRLD